MNHKVASKNKPKKIKIITEDKVRHSFFSWSQNVLSLRGQDFSADRLRLTILTKLSGNCAIYLL